MCSGIENANVKRIPLDVDQLANPTWWDAVIGGLHFDAAIEMNRPFAVLVITERLQWQWNEEQLFLSENIVATWRFVVPWMRL